MSDKAQIYVASLSDYVAGRLHGKWIDLSECFYDPDCVNDEIQEMLKQSKEMIAEEFAIHDYDNFPSNIVYKLGEYPSLERVCEIAEMLDNNGDMIQALMECTGDLSYLDNAEDHYIGAFDSLSDVKWFIFEEIAFNNLDNDIKDQISSYIDLDHLYHEWVEIGTMSCEYVDGTYYLFDFS